MSNNGVNIHIGPQTATAQAIAMVNNDLGGGGSGLPASYSAQPSGGLNSAPTPVLWQSTNTDPFWVTPAVVDPGYYADTPDQLPQQYGPPAPNYTPYNNGDYSTQQGGQLGPYAGQDANGAVARFGPPLEQPTYSTDVSGKVLPSGYQSPQYDPAGQSQYSQSGWEENPAVSGYRSDGTPYSVGGGDPYTAPVGSTYDLY